MFRAGMERRGLPALKQKTQKDGLLPMACELSGVGSFLFILGPYSTSAQGLFWCLGGQCGVRIKSRTRVLCVCSYLPSCHPSLLFVF